MRFLVDRPSPTLQEQIFIALATYQEPTYSSNPVGEQRQSPQNGGLDPVFDIASTRIRNQVNKLRGGPLRLSPNYHSAVNFSATLRAKRAIRLAPPDDQQLLGFNGYFHSPACAHAIPFRCSVRKSVVDCFHLGASHERGT